MPFMIALTSAKSTLTSPGTVIRSLMPCTAWRSTSSAMRKASASGVPRSTNDSSRSLGMVIRVSTAPRSSSTPRSACAMRRRPSKPNGLVTTATVSAPISEASEAMTGSAPVPVPPPRPAVRNTMSEPSSSSSMRSVSSSADLRPISGSPPAPRPLVSCGPSCSLIGARHLRSACRSVLAAMNSMPRSWASIIRLTALPPPPPTPITLILAGARILLVPERGSAVGSVVEQNHRAPPCSVVESRLRAGPRTFRAGLLTMPRTLKPCAAVRCASAPARRRGRRCRRPGGGRPAGRTDHVDQSAESWRRCGRP